MNTKVWKVLVVSWRVDRVRLASISRRRKKQSALSRSIAIKLELLQSEIFLVVILWPPFYSASCSIRSNGVGFWCMMSSASSLVSRHSHKPPPVATPSQKRNKTTKTPRLDQREAFKSVYWLIRSFRRNRSTSRDGCCVTRPNLWALAQSTDSDWRCQIILAALSIAPRLINAPH